MSHPEGTDEIQINESGIYQISYQLLGITGITGIFNFDAVLSVNNIALEDTINQAPVLRNSIGGNRMSLTATVILRLEAGDILRLNGVSIEGVNYNSARIDIEKIG